MFNITRILLFVVLIATSFENGLDAAGNAQSASELNNMINKSGEINTIRWLLSDTDHSARFFTKVEQASPEWIKIACRLLPHTDAGFASELESALSLALSKRPDLVLDLLDEQYVPGVCSAPFLIDYPDMKTGLKTLKKTRSKLSKLTSDKLAQKRTSCLSQIDKQINKIRDEQRGSTQSQLTSEKIRKGND